MAADSEEIEVICPDVENLTQIETNITCPVDGCTKILPNSSALRMHLVKTHKTTATEDNVFDRGVSLCQNKVKKKIVYCCPVSSCVRGQDSGRYFHRLAHVKQHYMNVHGEKRFTCKKCDKKFGRNDVCLRHEKTCGIIFPCSCGVEFNSRTSMLTHARRNGHVLPMSASNEQSERHSKQMNRKLPGSVCGLSHGTKIDTSDCAALLPTGILHLSLTKDTYECLGIQGKPSPFKNSLRFDIEINLLAQYFKPSKKFYERALRGFLKTGLKFKFLFSAISKSDDDEPSRQKLEAYFKSHGIIYEAFTNKQELQEFSELDIPVISYNNEPFLEVDSECNGIAFHEWLGCVVCGVDCSESASDSFVSTLSCPRPHHPGKAAFWKWTGFLHSDAVCEVIKLAREVLNKNPQVPWLSIMIWGFSDSPVSWRDHRHGYFLSGDNHSTVVVFQKEQLWLYRSLGDHDEQP